MATMIGKEDNLQDLLAHLIELDYDAIEAYDAAIERLDNPTFKTALLQFKNDHLTHTQNLGEILQRQGGTVPKGPDSKHYLTKGKVVIADMMGNDEKILKAMLSNEEDTNTAYHRAIGNTQASLAIKEVLMRNYEDEQKHKHWIENAIKIS